MKMIDFDVLSFLFLCPLSFVNFPLTLFIKHFVGSLLVLSLINHSHNMSTLNSAIPDAPSISHPLPQVSNSISGLVRSAFPSDCTHRHSAIFPLQNKVLFNDFVWNLPGFKQLVYTPLQYVVMESVEVIVDCWKSGTIIMGGLSLDAEAIAAPVDIAASKSHFLLRITDLSTTTGNYTLPFHNGMSRQVKPTPIDGLYPRLLLYTSGESEGMITVVVNYKFGGPILTRAFLFRPKSDGSTATGSETTDEIVTPGGIIIGKGGIVAGTTDGKKAS